VSGAASTREAELQEELRERRVDLCELLAAPERFPDWSDVAARMSLGALLAAHPGAEIAGAVGLDPDAALGTLDPGDRVLLADVVAYVRSRPRDFVAEISPDDRMNTHAVPYFPAGQAAVRSVRLAMLEAGRHGFESILDFGSGFGRVLRMLKAAFPEARLTATDMRRDAVDFCASALGATPVYSSHDPAEIDLEGSYDLIWCGSLFTHFSPGHWSAFLPFFESLLAPDGLLVFTTLGRLQAERAVRGETGFGLSEEAVGQMLSDYEETGFGFAHYGDDMPRLRLQGVSLTNPSWVCAQIERLPALRLVSYNEAGWGKQDVVACVRREHI
jgi:SAM-dependent methyltransferase